MTLLPRTAALGISLFTTQLCHYQTTHTPIIKMDWGPFTPCESWEYRARPYGDEAPGSRRLLDEDGLYFTMWQAAAEEERRKQQREFVRHQDQEVAECQQESSGWDPALKVESTDPASKFSYTYKQWQMAQLFEEHLRLLAEATPSRTPLPKAAHWCVASWPRFAVDVYPTVVLCARVCLQPGLPAAQQ